MLLGIFGNHFPNCTLLKFQVKAENTAPFQVSEYMACTADLHFDLLRFDWTSKSVDNQT